MFVSPWEERGYYGITKVRGNRKEHSLGTDGPRQPVVPKVLQHAFESIGVSFEFANLGFWTRAEIECFFSIGKIGLPQRFHWLESQNWNILTLSWHLR